LIKKNIKLQYGTMVFNPNSYYKMITNYDYKFLTTTLGLVIKNINNHHVKVVYLLCHAKISQSMGLLIVFLVLLESP
jgi:hypothetical protein